MLELHIPDMNCQHCSGKIGRLLAGLDPEATLDIDLSAKRIRVDTKATPDALLAALASAGYTATLKAAS